MKSMIVVGALFAVSGAIAEPCVRQPNTSVEIAVQEAPIVIMRDIPLAYLRAISTRLRRQPAHPVLGFYAGIVGYKLDSLNVGSAPSANDPVCLTFQLKAELVVVDRRVAVASDLDGSPCRLRAALEHYRHHAAAASLALHRFAAELQVKLGPEIERHMQLQPSTPEALHQYINVILDDNVGIFNDSLLQVQKDVDTESEIRDLSAPCDRT
jgi:hypothetical protein